MRLLFLFGTLLLAMSAKAQTSAHTVWDELRTKREQLPSLHQEFDVSQTYRSASSTQASKRQVLIDMAGGQWRERSISGSGVTVRVFDGHDLFLMDEGGDEFVRSKRRPKEDAPTPSPYSFGNPDWNKAVVIERRPCGLPGVDHVCVVLEIRLKSWMRVTSATDESRMADGSARMMLDTENGLLLWLRTIQSIERRTSAWQSDVSYLAKRMSYGAAADGNLFKVPAGLNEVKELSPWNAAKIRKEMGGKPAVELNLTDMQGKPLTLSSLRGKTVLLDFWTTWCPPCRADAPNLDKLYRKYGPQSLMIVGISVSEERDTVEKFLKEHPHSFPIALTTENEMPRPYQISAFPTYIVIEKDGTVSAAVEGDQGFGELRKLLRKAGMEVE